MREPRNFRKYENVDAEAARADIRDKIADARAVCGHSHAIFRRSAIRLRRTIRSLCRCSNFSRRRRIPVRNLILRKNVLPSIYPSCWSGRERGDGRMRFWGESIERERKSIEKERRENDARSPHFLFYPPRRHRRRLFHLGFQPPIVRLFHCFLANNFDSRARHCSISRCHRPSPNDISQGIRDTPRSFSWHKSTPSSRCARQIFFLTRYFARVHLVQKHANKVAV